MKTKHFPVISMLFILLLGASCDNDNSSKDVSQKVDTTTVKPDTARILNVGKSEMTISDIPFPFRILEELHDNKIPFDPKVVNPIGNISKYNQYNSKALNLGIYGADLSYVVTYEQFQQIGQYVKTAKKLADDLDIPFAFNQDMMDKYNKFKDNKDSLSRVVFDSYNEVDKKLKGDDRVGVAALVVAGSWLEGLYLSTRTFVTTPKTNENKDLYKVIGGQKQSLGIVVKLLNEYNKDAYINKLSEELKKITSLYDHVVDNEMMDEEQLVHIDKEVAKLRNRIVEGL